MNVPYQLLDKISNAVGSTYEIISKEELKEKIDLTIKLYGKDNDYIIDIEHYGSGLNTLYLIINNKYYNKVISFFGDSFKEEEIKDFIYTPF